MPRVTFLPGARTVDVERDERLLVAAWRAGNAIKSVCGGRGKCGTCLVRIEAGHDARALTPPHAQEQALLPRDEGAQHYRLACMARVEGDVQVSIPPESEAVHTPPRKPYTVSRIASAPRVSEVVVEVAGAYDAPRRPLAARIEAALRTASRRRAPTVSAPVLAAYSRNKGYDGARRVSATLLDGKEVIRLRAGAHQGLYGLAVDLGTTSIVVFVCDLAAGNILGVRAATNPQVMYGEDVISRMTHVQRDGALLRQLQTMLVDEVSRLAAELVAEHGLSAEDIVDVVAVGNPTMQHILLGINPEPLGRGPYLPVLGSGADVKARDIGLRVLEQANVFVLPMVAGYIGGDTLAAVLTRDRDFFRGHHLLIDVGTNGEVVLSSDGALTATSCATGPVYEGAHIRCGVRAVPGAIERVRVTPAGVIEVDVIADPGRRARPRPVGLCGSGVISAVAACVEAGIIRADGRIAPGSHPQVRVAESGHGAEILLIPGVRSATGRDIALTQMDIRNVQLGKAALRAGIEILLRESGVQRLDSILLAGTFGNHLQPRDILRIGMLPEIALECVRSIGNAAGDGARMALFNRHHRRRALSLARGMRVLELTERADFQDLFLTCTALAGGALPRDAALV